MKTAMQEFFLVMKEFNKDLYNTMYNEGILDKSLEKEKEQIIKAMNYGLGNEKEIELGEYYYNQTYNQNK